MALVTLTQVNAGLRLDLQGTAPDFAADNRTDDIKLKIAQAQDIVLDFIQPKPEPAWDASTVPGRVSAAIIMTVGFLLDGGEEAMEAISGLSGNPSPNNPLVALLQRLRRPTLA